MSTTELKFWKLPETGEWKKNQWMDMDYTPKTGGPLTMNAEFPHCVGGPFSVTANSGSSQQTNYFPWVVGAIVVYYLLKKN